MNPPATREQSKAKGTSTSWAACLVRRSSACWPEVRRSVESSSWWPADLGALVGIRRGLEAIRQYPGLLLQLLHPISQVVVALRRYQESNWLGAAH